MGAAEELARRNEENGQAVGAAAEGAGLTWAWPLFAAAPNRFACQVAGAAERAGSSACSTTDWSLELDGADPVGAMSPVPYEEG